MTFADQIEYCAILAGTVTLALAFLRSDIKKEEGVLKKIVYAFVYYGFPWALITFVLLELFSRR